MKWFYVIKYNLKIRTTAVRPLAAASATCNISDDGDGDELIDSLSTSPSRTFGGEGAVRRGGELNLPGVRRTLAAGGAPLDVPEPGAAAPRRPDPGGPGAGEGVRETCHTFL